MNWDRLALIRLRIPLRRPFQTSNTKQAKLDKLLLRFSTDRGPVFTECTAGRFPYYCAETVDTAALAIRKWILPLIAGHETADVDSFRQAVRPLRGHHPMARAAVENAYWIYAASGARQSLADLLGGERTSIPSGVSVGIQESTAALLDQVAAYAARGYRRVKLKIRPGHDLEPVRAVRERFPDLHLAADANAAYSPRRLASLLELDAFDLDFLEQPFDGDELVAHARLQRRLRTPVCLDESVTGAAALETALALGACRSVNLKQGRVGGLAEAVRIHDLAGEKGVTVWCGGMLETGIGRAVNAALASLPGFREPGDLSASDRYWAQDVVEPPFSLNLDGTLGVPTAPGLGVAVVEERIRRFTVHRETVQRV